MRKVWIVVANSSKSIIYRAENVKTLVEHKVFEHKESHLADNQLTADKQGRQTHRVSYGTDTYQEQTPTKVKESSSFAEEISAFLEEGYNNRDMERIYLVAKPPFLGFLRSSLSSNVAGLIASEIHKDLTQLRAEEVREYLPPVL
ncbi:MAG: host attachment protein [Chlamydiales bacterium]